MSVSPVDDEELSRALKLSLDPEVKKELEKTALGPFYSPKAS